MLAVYPNREISDEVLAFRQQLTELSGGCSAPALLPCITIAYFEMLPLYEDLLVRSLDEFCFRQLRSANVELSGFHKSEEFRAICFEPRQLSYFNGMIRKTAAVLKTVSTCRVKPPELPPVIPILHQADEACLRQAWELFHNKVYARFFYANNLNLLRLPKAPGETPKLLKSFSLL